nr:hypothetical protein [Tanacetum cinerariifolium]
MTPRSATYHHRGLPTTAALSPCHYHGHGSTAAAIINTTTSTPPPPHCHPRHYPPYSPTTATPLPTLSSPSPQPPLLSHHQGVWSVFLLPTKGASVFVLSTPRPHHQGVGRVAIFLLSVYIALSFFLGYSIENTPQGCLFFGIISLNGAFGSAFITQKGCLVLGVNNRKDAFGCKSTTKGALGLS